MSCTIPCVIGNQVPLASASSETRPPVAGPIESAVSRCPSRMPSAPNGTRADQRHLEPACGEADASETRVKSAIVRMDIAYR